MPTTERAEMNSVRLHVRALHFRLAVPHTTIDLNLTPTFIRLIYAVVARQLKGEWPAFSVRVEKPNDHIKRRGIGQCGIRARVYNVNKAMLPE